MQNNKKAESTIRRYVELSPSEQFLFDELMAAIRDKRESDALSLIERGAPLDAKNNDDRTPLHVACINDLEQLALTLIECGATIEAKDKRGSTPLHFACGNGREQLALALIDRGAPIDAENKVRKTSLHVACDYGHEQLALKLIDRGARIDARSNFGRTPLHVACINDLEQLALTLIERGAPVDAKDSDGETPLHVACRYGHEQFALTLIERGAPIDAKDSDGATPLHFACRNGREQLALKLIDRGAVIDAKDKFGETPLDCLYKGNVKDMLAPVAAHLIFPAMLLEAGDDDISLDLATLLACQLIPMPDAVSIELPLNDHAKARLMRPLRLSRSWHHPGVTFPKELLPLKPKRTWQALLEQPYHAPNGLTVQCLTSSQELEEESRQLDHCVGRSDYDERCCEDDDTRSHIFSIRNAEGYSLSTVEITYENDELVMVQHEGRKGEELPKEAIKAWDAFAKAVQQGEVTLTDEASLGETTPPDVNADIPKNWKTIGFKPSWEHINKCYDEYRMPYRRASLLTEGRNMDYDDIKTEDGYRHEHHLIDGWVIADTDNVPVKNTYRLDKEELPALKPGEKIIEVRTLDAKSMLRATGIMDAIHQEIDNQLGSNPERSARWQAEANEPLRTRPMPIPKYKVETVRQKYIANNKNAERLYSKPDARLQRKGTAIWPARHHDLSMTSSRFSAINPP